MGNDLSFASGEAGGCVCETKVPSRVKLYDKKRDGTAWGAVCYRMGLRCG